jgi:hypothetical protein
MLGIEDWTGPADRSITTVPLFVSSAIHLIRDSNLATLGCGE